jgi:hypothetical protein
MQTTKPTPKDRVLVSAVRYANLAIVQTCAFDGCLCLISPRYGEGRLMCRTHSITGPGARGGGRGEHSERER